MGRELVEAVARTRPQHWDLLKVVHTGAPASNSTIGMREVPLEPAGSGWLGRWLYLNRVLPAQITRQQANVFFPLSGYLSSRLQQRCGTISTANNMLPFTPEQTRDYSAGYRVKLGIQRRYLVRSLRMADAAVLHSRHALERIARYAGDISEKTRVVLTGVPAEARLDPDHAPPVPNSGQPYCFYLSVIRRYKNHLSLIDAYRRLVKAGVDIPELVIAGLPIDHDYLDEILRGIRDPDLDGRVRYVGALPQAELKSWLHHATINVFASGCETNSLVLAEILGAEGVLACSNVAPMPEIVESAAEFFNPDDPESIARTLLKLWRNPARRRELRLLAIQRSGELSWDDCGRAVWDAAQDAHEAFGRRSHGGRHRSA